MKQLLVILCSLLTTQFFAQSFSGLTLDNYSGVHGVIENPASIANSRHKFDLNLLTVSTFIDNDYASANFRKINDFGTKDLSSNPSNNVNLQLDILGPSLLFSLGEKQSIALTTRFRANFNANDINGETLSFIKNGFDYDESFNINEKVSSLSTNLWAEAGITYSRVVFDQNEHFLKAGVTAKYLQGFAAGNLSNKDVDINYQTNGSTLGTLTTSGKLNYAYSNSLQAIIDNGLEEILEYSNSDNTGYGFDIGAVYEWRPNSSKYKNTTEKGQVKGLRNKNKYLLKLSVSVNDIGQIAYKDGNNETYNLSGTISEQDYDTDKSLQENLNSLYVRESSSTTVNMKLPTSLKINLDYKATNNLYLNLRTTRSLVSNSAIATRASNNIVLTPRFEGRYISTYLPVGMYEHSGFQAGLGIRAGFLHLGSSTILSNAISKSNKAANVFIGLKIPISHGKNKSKVQSNDLLEVSETVKSLDKY